MNAWANFHCLGQPNTFLATWLVSALRLRANTKTATQNRCTVGNATGAAPPRGGPGQSGRARFASHRTRACARSPELSPGAERMVQSHCRFRSRHADSLSKSGIKWINDSTHDTATMRPNTTARFLSPGTQNSGKEGKWHPKCSIKDCMEARRKPWSSPSRRGPGRA
jgi:hypothetical protein